MSEIEDLRDLWVGLESTVQQRTLYCCYDYVIPWYHCYTESRFAERRRALVGLAWEGDTLVGITPMVDSRGSFAGIPVRRADCAGFNLAAGELLIRDGAQGVIEHFVDSLHDDLGFDVIALNGLDIRSQPYVNLRNHLNRRKIPCEYLDYDWYAVADLREGYDVYAKQRGSNFRKQTRKIADKIHSSGQVRLERLTSTQNEKVAREMLERMLALCEKTWRAKSAGLEMERQHHTFFRELFEVYGRKEAVDLTILMIDDRDAGFSFALVERGIYYHTLIGFDEELRDLSPGTHVVQEAFRTLEKSGIHTVLSHGSYEYKKRWASRIVPQYTVCVFGHGIRARLAYWVGVKIVRRRRA